MAGRGKVVGSGGVYAALPADEGGEGGVLLEDHGALVIGGNRCEARQRCVWRRGAAGQVER
nr:MAG TPA: hypothetical protein [Caudoviricetes sp.]